MLLPLLQNNLLSGAPAAEPVASYTRRELRRSRNNTNRRFLTATENEWVVAAAAAGLGVGTAGFKTKALPAKQHLKAPDPSGYAEPTAAPVVFVPTRIDITKRVAFKRRFISAESSAAFIAPPVVPPVAHEPGSERVVHFRTEFDRRHIRAPELAWSVQAQAPPGEIAASVRQEVKLRRKSRLGLFLTAPSITGLFADPPSFERREVFRVKHERRHIEADTSATFTVAAAPPVFPWPSYRRPEIFRSSFERKHLVAPFIRADVAPAPTLWPADKRQEIFRVEHERTFISATLLGEYPAPPAVVADWPSFKRVEIFYSETRKYLIVPALEATFIAEPAPVPDIKEYHGFIANIGRMMR